MRGKDWVSFSALIAHWRSRRSVKRFRSARWSTPIRRKLKLVCSSGNVSEGARFRTWPRSKARRGLGTTRSIPMFSKQAVLRFAGDHPIILQNSLALFHTFTSAPPVRSTSLSPNSVLLRLGVQSPFRVMAIPPLLIIGLLASRTPLTSSGLSGFITVHYLLRLAHSVSVYYNYDFFTIGALCLAVAVEGTQLNKMQEDEQLTIAIIGENYAVHQ